VHTVALAGLRTATAFTSHAALVSALSARHLPPIVTVPPATGGADRRGPDASVPVQNRGGHASDRGGGVDAAGSLRGGLKRGSPARSTAARRCRRELTVAEALGQDATRVAILCSILPTVFACQIPAFLVGTKRRLSSRAMPFSDSPLP